MAGRKRSLIDGLSRRERQIMDIIYARGTATAADVEKVLPDPPVNATVRKLLTNLEGKGLLRHKREGKRFVYTPTIPADSARSSALEHLLDTFFMGSAASAVVALLDRADSELNEEERDMILRRIAESKKAGR
jgi:BlaI family penicillinase repressor